MSEFSSLTPNINIHIKKFIDVGDWDRFVSSVYGRPYSLQQQDGCKERGIVHLSIPSPWCNKVLAHDEIPERVNDDTMCVKFEKWLQRDPKQPLNNQKFDWQLRLWWLRNFYPELTAVANDLYNKGLIEAGKYIINIDW